MLVRLYVGGFYRIVVLDRLGAVHQSSNLCR